MWHVKYIVFRLFILIITNTNKPIRRILPESPGPLGVRGEYIGNHSWITAQKLIINIMKI